MGRGKRALVALCAMAAVVGGGLIGAPSVHADEGDQAEQQADMHNRFSGDYRVGPGGRLYAGNCFTAGRSATFGGPPHTDCGIDRVVYNATGEAYVQNRQQHVYLGNAIRVSGGTVTLAGGIFEGNDIIADRIVIQGDAILVGHNRLQGEVEVEDPNSVAGELIVDRAVREDVNYTHSRLLDAERSVGWFMEEANFDRLDGDGYFAYNRHRDGRVAIHNVSAAANSPTNEYGGNARGLVANNFALFSAVATVDGPPDPNAEPYATREDFVRLHGQIVECREEMERALPSGPGASLNALYGCAQRNASEGMLFDDVGDRLSDIMR